MGWKSQSALCSFSRPFKFSFRSKPLPFRVAVTRTHLLARTREKSPVCRIRTLFANCRQGTVMGRMSHSLRSDADSSCLFNTPCYRSSLLAGRAELLLSFPSWHRRAGVYSSLRPASVGFGCPILDLGDRVAPFLRLCRWNLSRRFCRISPPS